MEYHKIRHSAASQKRTGLHITNNVYYWRKGKRQPVECTGNMVNIESLFQGASGREITSRSNKRSFLRSLGLNYVGICVK